MTVGRGTPRGAEVDRGPVGGTVAFFTLLAGLAALVFRPSIQTGFFIDDFGYLGVALPGGWWHSGQIWDFSAQVLRPVTATSIGIQQEIFGFHALPFHLVAHGVLMKQGVMMYSVSRRPSASVSSDAWPQQR